jgi:hypothetical protein
VEGFTAVKDAVASADMQLSHTFLKEAISRLCEQGETKKAIELLFETTKQKDNPSSYLLDADPYTIILQSLAKQRNDDTVPETVERVLAHMKNHDVYSVFAYNAAILAWSKSYRRNAGYKCEQLLRKAWEQYNQTPQSTRLPHRSMYMSALSAWARARQGRVGAERAEALLEEMERLRYEHEFLAPNTMAVNIVLYVFLGLVVVQLSCQLFSHRNIFSAHSGFLYF